jgi:serine/threonine protein phosphatase PrpC
MSREASTLTASGWTLTIGTCSSAPNLSDGVGSSESGDSYAIYTGDRFERPARGIVVVVARGVGTGPRVREAAQIATHTLAEGYFGATPTLGTGRAVSLALTSANGWIFSQSRLDSDRAASAVVTALIFAGRHIGIAHVGDCRVYRLRQHALTPLTEDHVRPLADGAYALTRTVGGDAELHIDYTEDAPERADRYIVLSKGAYAGMPFAELADLLAAAEPPENLACRLTAAPRVQTTSIDATAIVVDIAQLPEATFDELAASFSDLPLRGAPRDGENWDGFVLGRTIYRSRYTTLKLAHDTVNDKDVVLKIPLPSMLHDEVFRAGFLREAWVGATVRSPRIASYIDVPAERRSSLYLVLPYYRGETLEARLVRPPPIAYLDGVGLALKMCAAVQDLAALQIVHRDLKPDNIFLLTDGDIKLLDLGLAYLPGVDEPDDDRLGGTTRYMAPELFRKVPADQCSEVFSLGVTIYRLFSGGAFPYGQREAVPLQKFRPDLPPWLGKCLGKAMATDRRRRFQDAGELAKALEEGLRRGSIASLGDVAPTPRPAIALRIWQGLTFLFAVAFLITLWALLRRSQP